MTNATRRSSRAISSERDNGFIFSYRLFFVSAMAITFILFATLFFSSASDSELTDLDLGVRSARRSVLALKSDPLKPRVDQIRKQADDHRSLVLAYASYARKLKLENSKQVRVFADLARNYTE